MTESNVLIFMPTSQAKSIRWVYKIDPAPIEGVSSTVHALIGIIILHSLGYIFS